MRNRALRLAAFLAVALLASAGLGQASPSEQTQPAPVRLRAATFVPARGEAPAIPPGLAVASLPEGREGYFIVQFQGPVQQAWKDEVVALGAEFLDYVPDFAFKLRATPAIARQVEGLASVAWVGIFQPGFKLDPTLPRDGARLYTVQIERGADLGLARAAVAATGAAVSREGGSLLTVAADGPQVEAIAHVPDVAWIETFELWERHNDYAAGATMGARAANTSGYDGSSQIVGVADTGIGGGTATTAHPDIPAVRVADIFDWPGTSSFLCYDAYPDGSQDVSSGHGTHVAGSILSDGGPDGEGRGTAPAGKLVFQAVEDYARMYGLCGSYPSGYYLVGIPSDLRQLFQQAYDAGARVHSDSWGSDAQGDYDANSAYVDDFLWSHSDMAVTFSAGNAGTDANGDGEVDLGSTSAPATSKNAIAVGASENDRQDGYPCDRGITYAQCTGQNSIFTYGSAWGSSYPAEPLKSDPTAGNAEQMAAFSSRGPTSDGRIKPDVVAPGTWVLSGYSDLYQQGYDGAPNPRDSAWQYDGWGLPYSSSYKYMGGTSMSNPLTAGGAAVVRDFYQKANGHAASAALVKGTLINSAVDLLDEDNDGVDDNRYPIPNFHEGWGRVNLANATRDGRLFVDRASGLPTGAAAIYPYSVGVAGAPFKVTLVWTDYPSTASAAKNLVNDLDLVVTSPDGVVYRGNVFSSGWSQAGGSPDRTNNVENVYVSSAASGTWTVEVRAYNVPVGAQPFALLVDGASLAALPTPTAGPPTATPTATATPSPSPTLEPGAPNLAASANGGRIAGYSSTYGGSWDATKLIDGTMTYGWGSATGQVTNQYVIVELAGGGTSNVNRVRINPSATGGDPASANLRDFQIRVSTRNTQMSSFTTVLSATAPQVNALLEYTFPSVDARYVMLYAANNYGNPYWLEAAEMEVYAASSAPAATATATATPTTALTPTTTPTATSTPSAQSTPTATPTVTSTASAPSTATATPTAPADTATATSTATATPTSPADTATPTSSPTATPTAATVAMVLVHVGDLDGTTTGGKSSWTATVVVLVHDADHNPVSGSTVSGNWSGGFSRAASCTTGGDGLCSVTTGKIQNRKTDVSFAVGQIVGSNLTYQPSANHDPDGDSDGTTISLNKP